KGSALGCGFCSRAWAAPTRRAARMLFVGTGHAREGFRAGVWALFAGMARSYRKIVRLLLVTMVTVGCCVRVAGAGGRLVALVLFDELYPCPVARLRFFICTASTALHFRTRRAS